jgi:primosomal protein N' (replication factor Y)
MGKVGETGTFAFIAREEEPVRPRLFVDVALNRPVRCEFTYGVPPDFEDKIAPGMRVAVPLASAPRSRRRGRATDGVDLETKKIKYVALVLDEEALVGPDLLELTQWMAGYYACSWGEALSPCCRRR